MFSITRIVKRGTKVTHKNRITEKNDFADKYIEDSIVEEKNEIKDAENLVNKKSAKNNNRKNDEKMMTEEQIISAENMANVLNDKKIIKKDKGLIERTESSKIILTEDNRQLLND